jgi:predicted glutamine amidotransferase
MCRWLAYAGAPITLDKLLLKPDHSLIDQSWMARRNFVTGDKSMCMFRKDALPTNGDGFGIGWYGSRDFPGQYREVRPAWNDANLHNLCEQIESPMFLAHVRAAIGGTSARANCHPFRHGRWLYQYNGEINGFREVVRDLAMEVAPELYPCIEGNADTELCFYLALTYGLEHDPPGALARMVARVEQARADHGVEEPFRATMAAANGEKIWAVRYSSDRDSKTLYYSDDVRTLHLSDGTTEELPHDVSLLTSEPLELHFSRHRWHEVPEWTMVVLEPGRAAVLSEFEPAT